MKQPPTDSRSLTGRRLLISGVNGFLGASLAEHLAVRGAEIIGLLRPGRTCPVDGVEVHEFDLPDQVDDTVFEKPIDLLIHCAYQTRFRNPQDARRVNVDGAKRLFDTARTHAVSRILFVSSMSAHDRALSVYGQTKFEVETMLSPTRDAVIRPGHIIGPGGIFARTARTLAALPFIPLFYGGRQLIQTLHVDDVCRAVEAIAARELTGTFLVSEETPVFMREFYQAITEKCGRTKHPVVFPGGATWLALRMLERLGFCPPLSSDNLLGLKNLITCDVREDLAKLELRPHTMRESLELVEWETLCS